MFYLKKKKQTKNSKYSNKQTFKGGLKINDLA
jgi:hypothetical protein